MSDWTSLALSTEGREALAEIDRLHAKVERLREALACLQEALRKLKGWRTPAVLGEGDYGKGLLCGVEDRDLQRDGYKAMRYGYECALERVAEEIDGTISAALREAGKGGGA